MIWAAGLGGHGGHIVDLGEAARVEIEGERVDGTIACFVRCENRRRRAGRIARHEGERRWRGGRGGRGGEFKCGDVWAEAPTSTKYLDKHHRWRVASLMVKLR